MRSEKETQAGFTAIELMVAMATGLLLITGVFSILYQTYAIADALRSTITINTELREMFRLMAEGQTVGIAVGNRVHSARATNTLENIDIGRDANDFRLRLTENSVDLFSRRAPQTSIACVAANDPVVGCNVSQSVAVQGYLAQDPILVADSNAADSTSDDDDWISVTVNLIDPELEGRDLVIAGANTTQFYFIFGLNREL